MTPTREEAPSCIGSRSSTTSIRSSATGGSRFAAGTDLHTEGPAANVKRCPHCEQTKPLELFSRHAKRSDGRQSVCKECEKGYRKPTQRASDLKRNFGLTVEQWDAMLAEQAGGCAACGATEGLVGDHDHSCCPPQHGRKVARGCGECTRGILCNRCNQVLGMHHEDTARLRAYGWPALANYLELWASRQAVAS